LGEAQRPPGQDITTSKAVSSSSSLQQSLSAPTTSSDVESPAMQVMNTLAASILLHATNRVEAHMVQLELDVARIADDAFYQKRL
ncbi:unnamed protein product, partial [Amoebophrya sp. A25]